MSACQSCLSNFDAVNLKTCSSDDTSVAVTILYLLGSEECPVGLTNCDDVCPRAGCTIDFWYMIGVPAPASPHDPQESHVRKLDALPTLRSRSPCASWAPPVRGFVREVPLAFPALHLSAREGCPGHCGTLDRPGGNSGLQDALRHGVQWSSASVGALSLGTNKDFGPQVG